MADIAILRRQESEIAQQLVIERNNHQQRMMNLRKQLRQVQQLLIEKGEPVAEPGVSDKRFNSNVMQKRQPGMGLQMEETPGEYAMRTTSTEESRISKPKYRSR